MSKSPFKSTLLLLGAFVVLLAFIFFFASDSARQSSKMDNVERSYFASRNIEEVDRIVFGKGEEANLELIYSDSGWLYQGREIDDVMQVEFLEMVDGLPQGSSVSRNPDNWSEYGLSDESAASLELFKGDELLSVIRFGSITPGPGGIFMRRDDDSSVYKVATALQQYQYYGVDQWLKKDLINREPDILSSFTARIGEEKWTFKKMEDDWNLDQEGELVMIEDQEAMASYLGELFALKATGFESDVSIFTDPEQALSLNFQDGTEYIVSVDVQEEGRVIAQVTDGYDLFVLSKSIEDQLRPVFLAVDEIQEDEAVNE